MNFSRVFKFLIEVLNRKNIDFALIGGFALQSTGVSRTTQDIDLLILSRNAGDIKDIMLSQDYELIHESEDVLNFVGRKVELGRVDFLLAHRKYTFAMLKRATEKDIFEKRFKIKVLGIEDLIGLKVQSSSNDPQRLYQDLADIELLIRNNFTSLDLGILKEYFELFGRKKELDKIINAIKNAE